MARKTLVVGAGFTGGAIARLLRDARYASEVLVWEKNSIAGGRAMARSFPSQRDAHVDVGAQYWTRLSELNDDVRGELLRSGALVPFQDDRIVQDAHRRHPSADVQSHAVGPNSKGFRAVVDGFLEDTPVSFSTALESIEVVGDDAIKVTSTNGAHEIVNELVLTCPVPNILPILEQSKTLSVSEKHLKALEGVEYSQRFAVAYLFDSSIAPHVESLGWTARYVSKDEDDVVRFLCWDNLKKQAGASSPLTLLVHTSVPYGMTHMDDDKRRDNELLDAISHSVHKLLPFLPDQQGALLHRWRISQVTKKLQLGKEGGISEAAVVGASGRPAVLELSKKPRIIVAGDAFLGSNFDSCLLSAKAASAVLMAGSFSSAY